MLECTKAGMKGQRPAISASAAKLNDSAAISLGGAPLGQWSVLLHRLAFRGFPRPMFLALVSFAVERLGNCGWTANIGDGEYLDMKLAALILDPKHVADSNFSSRLGLDLIGTDASQVAGLGGEGACLEEPGCPEPFVDANGVSALFGGSLHLGRCLRSLPDIEEIRIAGRGDLYSLLASSAIQG